VTALPKEAIESMQRVTRDYLEKYRLLLGQGSDQVEIHVVNVAPEVITMFTTAKAQ